MKEVSGEALEVEILKTSLQRAVLDWKIRWLNY